MSCLNRDVVFVCRFSWVALGYLPPHTSCLPWSKAEVFALILHVKVWFLNLGEVSLKDMKISDWNTFRSLSRHVVVSPRFFGGVCRGTFLTIYPLLGHTCVSQNAFLVRLVLHIPITSSPSSSTRYASLSIKEVLSYVKKPAADRLFRTRSTILSIPQPRRRPRIPPILMKTQTKTVSPACKVASLPELR